jgi:CubicO group peptidase (beta-lactamase class C family)
MRVVSSKDLYSIIDTLILKKMKSYKVIGASVSIIDGHDKIYSKGYGFADKANKIKSNSDTVFKIGSITKVFTATAIMQLAEQGKIEIDKPVTDYIREFSVKSRGSDARPITIRDLLCHHSGLPCDDLQNYFSSDPESFKTVIDYLKGTYLVSPPGMMFYYSNLGSNLLGVIIEKVSEMPFHQYIEKYILKGINMDSSSILAPGELTTNISKPYHKQKEQIEGVMKYLPSGGIFSTANDMARFMVAVVNGGKGLFQDENTLNSMFIPQYPDNPFDLNLNNGLGWFIGKPGLDYAGKVIWHDGGTPNYFSLTVMIPERKLGITVLTNSSSGALMNHQITIDILNLLIEEKLGIHPPVVERQKPIKFSKEMFPEIIVRFITLSGLAIVSRKRNKLKARLPSGTFRLHPGKDSWYQPVLLLFGFIPIKLKQLSLIRIGILKINLEKFLAIEQLGFQSLQGREFKTLTTNAKWKERAGKYHCINEINPRLETFQLIYSKNGMYLSCASDKLGKLKLFLDTINDYEAIIYGIGRYSGETIYYDQNSIKVFGLEFKKGKNKTLRHNLPL